VSDHGRAHAPLSPSSAERWISCPASVRLIETLGRSDDGGSEWAEEGTRAHTLCEIEASREFGLTSREEYTAFKAAWLRAAEAHGDDVEEMERHAKAYVSLLRDIEADMDGPVTVRLELRVRTGIPNCWGTADAVLIGLSKIAIVDFKYGQGVVVQAEENPQTMLYGVGALELVDLLGTIEDVDMWIHQPRVGGTSRFSMTAEDLRAWRDFEALPSARESAEPDAHFGPSESACRWCPAAGICKVRAQHIVQRDFGSADVMDEEDLATAFLSLAEIRDWCNAVEAEALRQAYTEKKHLPGLKVVLSGGKRSMPKPVDVIDRLVEAGYERDKVARETVQTLTVLDRLVGGKARLSELLGDLLVKSKGSPALVSESDPRDAVDKMAEAQEDFRDPVPEE
jgi:hypothetical protein